MTPKFQCRVDKGKLHFEGQVKDTLDSYLKTLKDGFYELTVKPKKDRNDRSTQQNKYYWKVVIGTLSGELGYTPDELHELLKVMFLKKWIQVKEKEYLTVQSTTELTTTKFEDYMNQIRTWASVELAISIPDPWEIE